MIFNLTTQWHIYHFQAFSEKITWGEKTDWVGKKLTSQFFPRGKNWLGKKLTVTPVQYCLEIFNLCVFQGGGSGPPPPPWSAHGTGQCIHLLRYTKNPFYRAHRLLYDTAYFLSHAQFFKLTKHSFLNTIRVWSGSKPFFANVNSERKRDWYVHILSGKSKSIDILDK